MSRRLLRPSLEDPYLLFLVFAGVAVGTVLLAPPVRLPILWVTLAVLSVLYGGRQPIEGAFTLGNIAKGALLGLVIAVWMAIALGFGGAGLVMALFSPITDVNHYLLFVGLSAALAAAMLSIGMLISVFSGGRLKAISLGVVLWFLLFLLYDLGAVGLAPSVSGMYGDMGNASAQGTIGQSNSALGALSGLSGAVNTGLGMLGGSPQGQANPWMDAYKSAPTYNF